MKPIIFIITLFSLISLIYSACTSPKVDVSHDNSEKCGDPIDGCTAYDSTSTADAPKCGTCAAGKAASSDKTKCVTTISDCTTYAADGTCTACKTDYLLTTAHDKCLLGCQTEGTATNAGKCTACKDGYTLSSGACTKKANENANPDKDDDSSFGLHSSLLLLLFTFLL